MISGRQEAVGGDPELKWLIVGIVVLICFAMMTICSVAVSKNLSPHQPAEIEAEGGAE